MPSLFPENDVPVLQRDLPDALHTKLQSTLVELNRTSVPAMLDPTDFAQLGMPLTATRRTEQLRALSINEARQQMLAAFRRGRLGGPLKPPAIAGLEDVTDGLLRHDLELALKTLNTFDAKAPPEPRLAFDRQALFTACTAGAITYWESRVTKTIDLPNGGEKEVRVTERRTLPDFRADARLDVADVEQLQVVQNLLAPSPDRTFRLGLLRGEVLAARNEQELAIEAYKALLAPAPGPRPLREKFVAIRAGFAALALGDRRFRRTRVPDAAGRASIREACDTAVTFVTTNDITPDNPLRQHVEESAAVQIAKLEAGQNVLGFRDGYVPVLRPATLQALAERRVGAARDAVDRFEVFKLRADQIQDTLRELDFQQDIKELELAIAREQIAKAEGQLGIVDTQIEQIRAQREALDTITKIQIATVVFDAVSTGNPFPALGASIPGLASTLAAYSARKEDLGFQEAIAERQQGLARRDVNIARIGQRIAVATIDFLEERFRRIQDRELDADLYYAVSETFRALARRHLDEAIVWSFLFERAVAFLRMVPDLNVIRLDYGDGTDSLLGAPALLQEDLLRVVEQNVPVTKFQLLTEAYSLRTLFPVEFSRFLQTGRMDFAMSLYELSKRRPGVFRQRIRRVQVELQFPPPAGFTGRIRHRGSFLVRDRDTTPAPGQGRFQPTADELTAAFAALGAGAAQGISIGGVMPFLLDVDTIELSLEQPTPDPGDPDPDAFTPIEGYGPAGDWTLEVENVDLRFITDAVLRVTYVIPESDEALAIRVRGLLTAFEQELLADDTLDLIAAVPLRQRFPDALNQLASGEAQVQLARTDFPAGITGLRVKTVIVQLLDANRKGLDGVALEISRPGTPFRLERSTRADGLSEDVGADIPVLPRDERPDVEGLYMLRGLDPARLAGVKDATVFVLYEFSEA